MPLIQISDSASMEDMIPVVQYDAKAGRMHRVDRDNGESHKVDITQSFKAVIDFENAEVGSIFFSAGSAPQWALAPYGTAPPPKPSKDFRDGIRLMMKLHASCGGDVRELAVTAKVSMVGLNMLFDEYLAQKAAHPGMLPIVVLQTTVPVTSTTGQQKTTNYQPRFAITGWAPRPVDLVFIPRAASATNGGLGGHPTPPSTGGTRIGAPITGAATPPPADDNDFG